jgi:cytochrome c-type biogenesis protein CcmH
MTIFWVICTLFILLALLFVVLPLWRSSSKNNAVQRDAANVAIFRDQIAEMDTDLKNGLLTPELHEQGQRELQSRLLDEVKADSGETLLTRNPLKALAIILAVLLPLASVGLYWKIGNLNALSSEPGMAASGDFGGKSLPEAIKMLKDKVANNPNDGESLLLLARSYTEMENFGEAVKVYEKLTEFVTDEAWIWADYADALAMVHGQKLAGPPTKLIEKALALDSNHPKTLALAGSAAMERGDYPAAIKYWERLLKGLPEESEDAKMISDGLRQARDFMAQTGGRRNRPIETIVPQASPDEIATAGKERISGVVTLSAALKSKANPTDTVFILARVAQGSKMPLAIIRKQVKDLPISFDLDDSMAMTPQMRLSNFEQVVVLARISKSGNAMPEAGDLEGVSQQTKPGVRGLKITIDTVK